MQRPNLPGSRSRPSVCVKRMSSAPDLFGVIKAAKGSISSVRAPTALFTSTACPDVDTQTGSHTSRRALWELVRMTGSTYQYLPLRMNPSFYYWRINTCFHL